jgi:hypothetical protein
MIKTRHTRVSQTNLDDVGRKIFEGFQEVRGGKLSYPASSSNHATVCITQDKIYNTSIPKNRMMEWYHSTSDCC